MPPPHKGIFVSTIILCISRFNHVPSGDTLRRDAISSFNITWRCNFRFNHVPSGDTLRRDAISSFNITWRCNFTFIQYYCIHRIVVEHKKDVTHVFLMFHYTQEYQSLLLQTLGASKMVLIMATFSKLIM